MDLESRSLKSQMKRADRLDAPIVLILGEDEVTNGTVTVRNMRSSEQHVVPRSDVIDRLRRAVRKIVEAEEAEEIP